MNLIIRQRYLRSEAFQLFLISFLILFLELVFIRWLSSYVLYLGYFTNFVLLGTLLGIGAGALVANRYGSIIKWLPTLMFAFLTAILFTRAQLTPYFEEFIYFTSTGAAITLPSYVLLPLIFIGVAVIFTLLSHPLGSLFTLFEPLKAYGLNILGSLAGIAFFTLLSFLSLPSWTWFLVAFLLLILFLPKGRSFGLNVVLLLGIVCIIWASDYAFQNVWSPYYRLNLFRVNGNEVHLPGSQNQDALSEEYLLLANGAGHQEFTSVENSEPFYHLPYVAFDVEPEYKNALVIGSGGGNDVAAALAHGVNHIDAVEIDPRIVELGQKYHPENPYNDPRVDIFIDDARSYLEKNDTRYDLIIFALPDSLVLASSMSNLRLESFLFTQEAFQSVKEHLTPDGLFVLYNYYRFDWLVDKISSMLQEVFGSQPIYHRYLESQYTEFGFATIYAGPKASEVDMTKTGFTRSPGVHFTPATDNWPFLYLKEPTLPIFYSLGLAFVLLTSFLYIWKLSPRGAISEHGLPFFFMGCAFTLLEAKSIVQFLLLFGSTWLVNSLVFFAILLVVLIANWLVMRYSFSRLWIIFVLLFGSLALNIVIPLRSILFSNPALRYLIAAILLFSPIFFANLIYSSMFRGTDKANVAFGANLLGTMFGGATEYLALYMGYQNLVLLAGAFYFLALYLTYRRQTRVTRASIA